MTSSYTLGFPDCGSHYFADAPPELFCGACGSFIGEEPYFPDKIKITGRKLDFGATYDNRDLLSLAAKEFLLARTRDVDFVRVNHDPEIFVPIVKNIVEVDVEKSKTRFVDLCDRCGQYGSIVGGIPPYLKDPGAVRPDGLYRSDIGLGSGRGKYPVLIVGEKLKLALEERFKELDFFKNPE